MDLKWTKPYAAMIASGLLGLWNPPSLILVVGIVVIGAGYYLWTSKD